MTLIWTALGLLAALGAVFGWILAFASKKLAIETDPRVEAVIGVLPGANCGACGYPGCSGLAEAIVAGVAPVNACPVGKAPCALKIGAIMGIEVDPDQKPRFAQLLCHGGKAERVDRFYYMGVADCGAAQMMNGGYKMCEFGCLGLGNCTRVCKFEAITINENELPVINRKRCTGCGACVQACPRGLINLVDEDSRVTVICKSHGKGPDVRKSCKVGCIGCGICAKNCPAQAITITDNLAAIDPQKCTACGICVAKCPMKTIHFTDESSGKEVAQVTG